MNAAPIGVFDSGVGGLTVFCAVERAVPGEALVYLGDTARVPYGTRSPETVVRYSIDAARFLRSRGIKLLVVACNTASAVALGPLAEEAGVPVLGVIGPGARRAADASRSGRIGVIGTRATVKSDAYATAIHALRKDAAVFSHACPLFVPLAEEGFTDDAIARQVAERYLAPLKEAAVDTLVLGCTHYPLLGRTIGEVMGPDVMLVDSADAVAQEVREWVGSHEDQAAGDPTRQQAAQDHHFFVTDSPEPFQQVAERFLGRPIRKLERV